MGMHVAHSPQLIDKEKIPGLAFPDEDVLALSTDKAKRMRDVRNANELGDLAQYKVKILFEDNNGKKKVETTVWNVNQHDVVLKYGIRIPIRRIHAVNFP